MARSNRVLAGPRRPLDLILVCAVVAVAALLPVYFPSSPLSWIFGFAAVFFCPGYAIVAALLPGRREILAQSFMFRREERIFNISMLERSALAVGLSATAVALVTTIMTRGLWDLTSLSVSLVLIVITFTASVVALYRRSRLPPGDQFSIELPSLEKRPFSRAEKGVMALIVASIVLLGVVGITALQADRAGQPYSELYIAGADGQLEHLPSYLVTGQQGMIRVTAVNHLGKPADYTLYISLGQASTYYTFDPGQPVPLSPGYCWSTSFTLADEGQFERTLSIVITTPGQWTVLLRLVGPEGTEPMEAWLPITVS